MNMYPFENLIPGEPAPDARFREEYARLSRRPKRAARTLTVSTVSPGDLKARLLASTAGYTAGF